MQQAPPGAHTPAGTQTGGRGGRPDLPDLPSRPSTPNTSSLRPALTILIKGVMTIACFLGTSTLAPTTLEGMHLPGHLSPPSDYVLLDEKASVFTVLSVPILSVGTGWHSSKCFTYSNSFNLHANPMRLITIIMPIIQTRILRHREVKDLLGVTQLENGGVKV